MWFYEAFLLFPRDFSFTSIRPCREIHARFVWPPAASIVLSRGSRPGTIREFFLSDPQLELRPESLPSDVA